MFDSRAVADGYANDRPFFHPIVIERIRSFLDCDRYDCALDIGCGSGLSAIALKKIAKKIIAIDSSKEMIAHAICDENITYKVCSAEAFKSEFMVDIITLSGAINWIDEKKFFPQVRKNLKPRGWLVVYDNNITGDMVDEPSFSTWYRKSFSEKFPRPLRKERKLDSNALYHNGLKLIKEEEYSNKINFDLDSFIRYLFTQSNITNEINKNEGAYKDIESWLFDELNPIFKCQSKEVLFGGYVWYVRFLSETDAF